MVNDVGELFVVDFDFGGRVLSLLEGICNHDGYILAIVVNLVVLEGRADLAGAAAGLELGGRAEELVGITVMDDGEDAGQPLGDRGIDVRDPRVADGGSDGNAEGDVVHGVFDSVAGGSGDLQRAVNAGNGRADDGCAHDCHAPSGSLGGFVRGCG